MKMVKSKKPKFMIPMSWLKSFKILIAIVLMSFSQAFLAQDLQTIVEKYPRYNEYIIQESQTYYIGIQKEKLMVTSDNYYESMIISKNGIHNNQESFRYSPLVPLVDFSAHSMVQQGKRMRKLPVTQIAEVTPNQRNIFHSGV